MWEQNSSYDNKTTYTMRFKCYNCGTIFTKEIPRGKETKGHGGECSYCGVVDLLELSHKAISRSQTRGIRKSDTKHKAIENKFEKMLKIVLLVLSAQTAFDQVVQNRAAKLLGYIDYEGLSEFWYHEQHKSYKEINEELNSIQM